MNWLTWQQHKKQFMIMAIFLIIFVAIVVPVELHLWPLIKSASDECNRATASITCVQQKVSSLDSSLFGVVAIGSRLILLAVPFVLGLFWGVPLVANEYINGTNKLIWTRSISRNRWLTVKLMWILLAAALFAGVFAALSTWWSRVDAVVFLGQPTNLGTDTLNRFTKLAFDTQGIAPAAYAFFAVALGIALGAWFKRILTGLAVTFVVLLALQLAVPALVRPHYETAKAATIQLEPNGYNLGGAAPVPAGVGQAWVLSGAIKNNEGQTVNFGNPPAKCSNVLENGSPSQGAGCLIRLGYHWSVQYQPANRFWTFQSIETGLYLALSLIPIGVTYWLVLKRDA